MSSSSDPTPTAPAARHPRRRRLLVNLAISAGTFALCLVLFEVILRLAGYGRVEIYEPDPLVFWRLKPDQRCYTKVDRRPVRVNSQGTRGPEFSPAKPPGVLRIISLGDSRTFGWGLAEEQTYSSLVATQLQDRAGARGRVEVINAGVNAWGYPQMLAYFRHRGLPTGPDAVIIGDGNLWTQFSEGSDPAFIRSFMGRVRLKNLLRRSAIYHFVIEVQLQEVYAHYRTRFIPVNPSDDTLFKDQQQADPDALFRRAIEETCRLARTNGVRPVMIYLPTLTELSTGETGRILAVKEEISRRLGVPLIDLREDLRPGASNLFLAADPVHLNAEGNRIVARRLTEALGPLLLP